MNLNIWCNYIQCYEDLWRHYSVISFSVVTDVKKVHSNSKTKTVHAPKTNFWLRNDSINITTICDIIIASGD